MDPGASGSDQSSADQDSEESDAQCNEADVEFASGMIPHHEQAVTMSELALDQGGPEVAALADEIQAAQGPEIDLMTQWLRDWGQEVPMSMEDMEMEGHDMGDMGMEGMMSAEEMQALEEAEGQEFDTLWLEMMIEHHRGAISMAETEQAQGLNPEAIDLAASIAETQAAEISQMESMGDPTG